MPVVQNTAENPGGAPRSTNVTITLVTGSPSTPGYVGSTDIAGSFTVSTDQTGAWSATLVGNSLITPANTYYQVYEGSALSNIVVPATGGPYELSALLVTEPPTPAAVGITGVQVATDGTVAGVRPEFNLIAGSGITVTAADNSADNRVDVTLTSTGGGAVESVNTQTGIVVLTAGDVGADTAGSAAAAQTAAETFATTAAGTAQSNAETFATAAVATETTRAEGVEATKLTITNDLSELTSSAAAARTNLGIVAATSGVEGLVTPPGGTTTFLRADGTWAAPPGGVSTAYSRQVAIAADGPGSTITPPVGTWTPTYLMTSDTGGVWSGWVNVSDGAQNDSISFDLAAGAGTYGLELRHLAYNNRGIYTIQIDGVSVGTIDGYAASLTAARSILTGITVSSGTHVITLLMATQNASATGFFGLIERLLLTRTA